MLKGKIDGLEASFRTTLEGLSKGVQFDVVVTEGKPETAAGSHVKESAHFKGLAADIRAGNGWERYCLVAAALGLGIKRIGVYDKHIHIDVDPTLPKPVIWSGKSH